MKTEFSQAFLYGYSSVTDNVEKFNGGYYDLAFFASSWDSRCVEIEKQKNLNFDNSVLLLFERRDAYGYRDRHDKILNNIVNKSKNEHYIITDKSEEIDNIWKQLKKIIYTVVYNKKKPINLFIDISTYPKYFALGIIAICLKLGFAKKIKIFYSEAKYGNEAKKVNEEEIEYIFTLGKWDTRAIPFLKSIHDPGKKKYYLVSVGFEGNKTMQIVNRKDPDRVSLLFPDPGYMNNYISKTYYENKELIDSYQIPEKHIIKANAGDAIEAWKILDQASPEKEKIENVHYLCCGTKPHAIALALRAICLEYPTVLYRLPEKHKFVEVEPIGRYWEYEVNDSSASIL
jgi:hypothetical protein